MKFDRRIERFLKRINVVPDPERKRLGLEALLGGRDKIQKPTLSDKSPTIRKNIINRQVWKIAASLVVAMAVIGVIGILQNGDQGAYAFERTVTAMQGKRFFHIRTYHGSPTRCKDEFWAEFDAHGQVIRLRQVEWLGRKVPEVEVIWEDQIKYQYELDDGRGAPGILLISNKKHHVDEDDLEEFDPETLMERISDQIDGGEATISISHSQTQDNHIIVEVTNNDGRWRRVLLVDSKTDLVLRMDTYVSYDPDDEEASYVEGQEWYSNGIEVLVYNQMFDPNIFQPNFPADTIIIDQTVGSVGMVQGDLSDKDVAFETVRWALEAWSEDEYDTAGLLFGGAPKEFFTQRASEKPIGDVVLEEPEWLPLEPNRPRYRVICSYIVEREGRRETIRTSYCVTTVAGQPGRWFVTPIKL